MNVAVGSRLIFMCSPSQIRCVLCLLSILFLYTCGFTSLHAQTTGASNPGSAPPDAQRITEIEQRLNTVTDALSQTQQELERSRLEIQKLRAQIDALRGQPSASTGNQQAEGPQPIAIDVEHPTVSSSTSTKDDLRALRDGQDTMQAEIKQHEQIKVETTSKYPLRVSGLALFNGFSNVGVVNDVELPTFALPRVAGASHGSTGATLRQTLLGLEATGPRIGGARSSAAISLDFFGGVASNSYGYSSSAGTVRMRQAQLSLTWDKTTVQGGYEVPLITPLSPTSYATVAQPGLSGSGNLWTWSPELRVEQRIPLSDGSRLSLEGGLVDPQSPGYTADQLDSPVEASRQPGYEGRVSYHAHDDPASGVSHPFVLGIGAYSAHQFYNSTTHVHSWAVTADWQIPLSRWFEITGEAYRGRALGGFGGGEYKDILMGTDLVTGLPRSVGVDTVGGWSQLKLRLSQTIEANASFGLDNVFSSNFEGLDLSKSTYPLQLNARNSSVVGNIIYRPKSYLILSPEYRRIQSWSYTGPASIANIFTLTAGFQF
jgi:hypothetical protein